MREEGGKDGGRKGGREGGLSVLSRRQAEETHTLLEKVADLVQYQQKDLHPKEEVREWVGKWENICAKSLLKHNREFLIVAWPYMLHS